MKRFCFVVAGSIFLSLNIFGQSSHIKPLTVGDVLPNMTINNIVNYQNSSINLSDLKGKVLILDFFSTWCSSCIAELPRLDTIQRQFGDKIQIFVVDYENQNKITHFLKHNSNVQTVSLPFVTSDSTLSKYFPHRLIPHDVWIDGNRKIAAITQSYYITQGNLQDLINGKSLNLPLKKDEMDYSVEKPLLDSDNEAEKDKLLYRTVFSRYLNGVGSMSGFRTDNNRLRLFFTNGAIIALYKTALPDIENRIILEVKDSAHYIRNDSIPWDAWASSNCYSYEISAPLSTPKEKLREFMLQDLNRYLGLNGTMETRLVKCWALVRTTNENSLLQTKGGKPQISLYGKEDTVKFLRNQPLSQLISALNYQIPSQPLKSIVIDETGYTGNVDLELHLKDIQNIPALHKALQPYGLALIPVKQELEMFVITEIDYKKNTVPIK